METKDIFTATSRYDARLKLPPLRTYKYLTLAECKEIRSGSHVLFVTRQGDVAQAKVTSVKLWKTRPNDVRIGLKYGLYEYATAEFVDGESRNNYLVREIKS